MATTAAEAEEDEEVEGQEGAVIQRRIKIAIWVVGALIVTGLALCGVLFLYYRPTLERAR
jgi:hypothetical protein